MEKEISNKLTLNQRLKQWARKLKNEVIDMYFAIKHPHPLVTLRIAGIIWG